MAASIFDELQSFLWKFTDLWKNGRNANLEFEVSEGKANISLKLNLGEHPFAVPENVIVNHKYESPSKKCRREKHAKLSTIPQNVQVTQKILSESLDYLGNNNTHEECSDGNALNVHVDIESCAEFQMKVEDSSCQQDYIICTYGYWNDGGNLIDHAVQSVNTNIRKSFSNHHVLENEQFFEILEAKIALNDDDRVHVMVKFKKTAMLIAKTSRMAYSTNTGEELSLVKISQ